VEPPDTLEKGTRLGCGFLFGCFVGFIAALEFLPFKGLAILAGCLVGGLLCAVAALRYGDRFWLGASRVTRWGRWPEWRDWWWRRF